jgi:hypothetical protein
MIANDNVMSQVATAAAASTTMIDSMASLGSAWLQAALAYRPL